MQQTTAGYALQVESASQPPAARVRVDWRRAGTYETVWCDEITVERSITTDLPAEATLISGISAATATVGLTGDPTDNTKTAAYLYSPYRRDSPLFGVEIEGAPATVELGQQVAGTPELFTALKGQARDLSLEADADGSHASLQLVDGRENLRFPPVLPLIVAADVTNSLQPGLNSQWIADAIYRQGGYYASPPPFGHPGSLVSMLSVPMHGSAAVDTLQALPVGLVSAATASGGPIQFQPCKFALGTKPDPVDGGLGTMEYTLPIGFMSYAISVYAEMWVIPAANSYPNGDLTIRDDVGAAATRIRVGNNGTNYFLRLFDTTDIIGPAVTNPSAPHYLAVYIYVASGTTIAVTWRVDGVTTVSTPIAGSLSAGSGRYRALVKTYNSIEALQIIDHSAYGQAGLEPPWQDAFTPTAVLEPGENELVAMPPVDSKTEAGTVLQQLAAAEGAVALADEPGIAQWWSRKHWGTAAAATTVQRRLKAAVPVQGVTVQRLVTRVRNVIRVAYTPVTVRPAGVVWTLSELIQVPAGATVTRWVDLSPDQAYQLDTTGSVMVSGGPTVDGRSSYRAARNSDGTGGELRNLTMQITPFAASVKIAWSNPNAFPVWLVTPAGAGYPSGSVSLPTSALYGQLITSQGLLADTGAPAGTGGASTSIAEARWDPSVAVYGERVLSIDSNPWRQTGTVAQGLADDTLHATAWPCPQLGAVTIVADSALQLGDRVTVEDDSGITGLADHYWIVGNSGRTTADGAEQDVVLRPVARPSQLMLGIAGRSELGGPNSQL